LLTDERYKQLMEEVGLPNSQRLLIAFRQCAREAALAEREACARVAEAYEPDEKLPEVRYASRDIRARGFGGGLHAK